MYKIKILCVGKLKENFHILASNEYLKRLSKYAKIELIEVKDQKINENASNSEEEVVKNKESETILKLIKPTDYVCLIDLRGKEYDSIELASKLNILLDNNFNKTLTFIIAGSLGFGEELRKIAKEKIKLSCLTFTHQMTRVILLEQIYRCFKINNNEIYHK